MSEVTSNVAVRSDAYRGSNTGSVVNRAVPVTALAEWQIRAIEKIASLGELVSNWDSYGSPPISDQALRVTIGLIRASQVDAVAIPRIVPMSGGGIHVEWNVGHKKLRV